MKTIYVECGTTVQSQYLTGIQRVVRSVLANADDVASDLGVEWIPVEFINGEFYLYDNQHELIIKYTNKYIKYIKYIKQKTPKSIRWLFYPLTPIKILFQRMMASSNRIAMEEHIVTTQGSESFLLLLDSTWNNDMWPSVKKLRASGVRVGAVLYDLIPFTHPHTVESNTRRLHTKFWSKAPSKVDLVICISNSVRNDFLRWQLEQKTSFTLHPEQIKCFNLGSDFNKEDSLVRAISNNTPLFLIVGSLEPRKNHAIVIEAFEKFWKRGENVALVIFGKHGWKSDGLIKRIKNHSEYGHKLIMVRDGSDRDLAFMYKLAKAVIVPSIAEGYGLPIVEALNKGAKVFCSDIPVFREVGKDFVNYFDPLSAESISAAIEPEISGFCPPQNKASSEITWKDSTLELFKSCLEIKSSNIKLKE